MSGSNFQARCVDEPVSLADNWADPSKCPFLYRDAVEGDLPRTQRQMQILFTKVYPAGIPPVGQEQPLQTTIFKVCQAEPRGCSLALLDMCRGQTRERVGANGNVARYCGCYMPVSAYPYTDAYGVPRECDSVCLNSTSIPWTTRCTTTVCLIDSVSIQLQSGTVGDISFQQLCSACGVGSCQCVIGNIDLTVSEAELENLDLKQNCGNTQVPGSEPEPGPGLWVALTLLGLVVLGVVLILVISSISQKQDVQLVRRAPGPAANAPVGPVAAGGASQDPGTVVGAVRALDSDLPGSPATTGATPSTVER